MNQGDIIDVMNLQGQIYEAVLRSGAGNIWEIEWLSGPDDTKQQLVVFEDE